jgi:hypothetical protein
VTEAKKTRKPGRPKLPRGESKGKFLRVRFAASEIRAIESAAKVRNQSVSEWVRGILRNSLQDIVPVANQVQGSRSNDARRIREGRRNLASKSEVA